MTFIRVADVPPVPWKNGGGTTRELLVRPPAPEWRVRLSVADIDRDGPFSPYPGVTRWFVVLQGAGVELDLPGGTQRLMRTSAPLRFDGGDAPDCRLIDGPTRDLNLMLRGAEGRIELVDDGLAWTPGTPRAGLLSAVAGRCEGAGHVSELPPYALLWFDDAPASLTFTADQRPAGATGWWIAAA